MWSAGDFEPPTPSAWMSLRAGETLLWVGRPSRSPIVFRWRDVWPTVFGLIWAVLIGRAFVGTLQEGQGSLFLIGLPFLAGAFYLVIGRFAINWYLRRQTTYALTTERIMIHRGGFRPSIREKLLARVSEIRKRVGGDGSGTLWFYDGPKEAFELGGSKRSAGDLHMMGLDGFQLCRIPDAAAVVALLENSTDYNQAADRRLDQDGRPSPSPWREG